MFGPPGSGKGTCARIISQLYNIPIITTGEVLREATNNKTKFGKIAKCYMDKGELVPDDIVNSLIKKRLNEPGIEKGFILDGYPRSIGQADALDKILIEKQVELDYVVHVYLEDEIIVKRLSLRRICPFCGDTYHLITNPPKKNITCDECGTTLSQRSDDNEDVIRNRLEVYKRDTQPLLERYDSYRKIKKIRGDEPLDKLPIILRKLLS
jgi:adenylate kinase